MIGKLALKEINNIKIRPNDIILPSIDQLA